MPSQQATMLGFLLSSITTMTIMIHNDFHFICQAVMRQPFFFSLSSTTWIEERSWSVNFYNDDHIQINTVFFHLDNWLNLVLTPAYKISTTWLSHPRYIPTMLYDWSTLYFQCHSGSVSSVYQLISLSDNKHTLVRTSPVKMTQTIQLSCR